MAEENTTAVDTRWCNSCHRRHPVTHEHFTGDVQPDDTARTILGTDSAKGLAEQVKSRLGLGKGKKGEKKTSATEQKLTAEEQERRRAAFRRLGAKFAKGPFSIAAIVTQDKNWVATLAEEEIKELAEDWVMFCEAFGFQAAGKVTACLALGIGYAEIGGAVYVRVEHKKKEAETASGEL